MTMHKAILPPPVEPDQFSGRRRLISHVPTLLAVLAARQRILPTVTAMRSHGKDVGAEAADHMVRMFVENGTEGSSASGAFNAGIARFLSGAEEEGEGGVYRGA